MVLHAGEHSRLHEVPLSGHRGVRSTPDLALGTFFLSRGDVCQNSVKLSLVDLGSLEGVRAERIADFRRLLNLLNEEIHEFIMDAFIHQNPAGGRTDLTLIRHHAIVTPLDGLLKLRIVKDDRG